MAKGQPPVNAFKKGDPNIPKSPGPPVLTALQKAERKAARELVFDLKQEYAKALPQLVARVVTAGRRRDKSVARDRLAKEILSDFSDRIYGRPAQAITGSGGGPLLVSFAQVLQGIDGAKQQPLP
jgi:hypothetical protein